MGLLVSTALIAADLTHARTTDMNVLETYSLACLDLVPNRPTHQLIGQIVQRS